MYILPGSWYGSRHGESMNHGRKTMTGKRGIRRQKPVKAIAVIEVIWNLIERIIRVDSQSFASEHLEQAGNGQSRRYVQGSKSEKFLKL